MTTVTTTSNIHHLRASQAPETGTTEAPSGPGKSAESVGHRAKAEIAPAMSDQLMPANIQGKVASALARGLPLDTLLALNQSDETDTADTGTDVGTGDTTDTTDTGVDAGAGDVTDTTDTVTVDIADAADTTADSSALDLLIAGEDDAQEPAG